MRSSGSKPAEVTPYGSAVPASAPKQERPTVVDMRRRCSPNDLSSGPDGRLEEAHPGLLLQRGELLRDRGRAEGECLGDRSHRAAVGELAERSEPSKVQHGRSFKQACFITFCSLARWTCAFALATMVGMNSWYHAPLARERTVVSSMGEALGFHRTLPGYAPTPLVPSPRSRAS
jgi:hypothetical protein